MELIQGIKNTDLQLSLPEWATKYPIISGYRGSYANGTYLPTTDKHGTDDIDVFTIFAHDINYYLGLDGYHNSRVSLEKTGDLDIVGYEIRKFIGLLIKGNPNVHSFLWLEPKDYLFVSNGGELLILNRTIFLSQRLFNSFAGYAYGQLKRMTHLQYQGYMGKKRKQLANEYGYDIRNAAHCLRLLYLGIHFASTGNILVKLPAEELDMILRVKRGEVKSIVEINVLAESLFQQFRKLEDKYRPTWPITPNMEKINSITRKVLEMSWGK